MRLFFGIIYDVKEKRIRQFKRLQLFINRVYNARNDFAEPIGAFG